MGFLHHRLSEARSHNYNRNRTQHSRAHVHVPLSRPSHILDFTDGSVHEIETKAAFLIETVT